MPLSIPLFFSSSCSLKSGVRSWGRIVNKAPSCSQMLCLHAAHHGEGGEKGLDSACSEGIPGLPRGWHGAAAPERGRLLQKQGCGELGSEGPLRDAY